MIRHSRGHLFQVPRRFGLRTVLVVTALFAAMLSILKWTEMSPDLFIFYFSLVIVVGGAQVVVERKPRLASILSGVAFVAILKFVAVAFEFDLHTINVGLFEGLFSEGLVMYSLVFGALYGYLTGTLLAGLYLVLDALQHISQWRFRQNRMSTGVSP